MAEEIMERTLERTPTWAVATVCFILLFVSIFIEHLLELIAKYFGKKRRRALIQALDKIKSELMLLGFVSLLLTVSEKPIVKICIPESFSETFIPCPTFDSSEAEDEITQCAEGKVSLLSRKGVQQLQYLIFVLAVFHVFSCMLTFSLGVAKMRRWRAWEAETRTLEYQFANDPRRFKLIHQTSFGKRHLRNWSNHRILRWPVCFLRQFYKSVSKVDYFTLRHGFITAHFTEGSDFDFQKYIRRALETDFGVIVGIRWWIWVFSMCFLFFNADGFHNYLWLPFIPLLMLLVVGTNLQSIITKMSIDSHNKAIVVRGTFLVRPSDHFFWLARPKLLLHLMHFILFQNSFQLAFFTWTWYKFGLRSCFHRKTEDIVIRIAMGIIVQILCGYVTLPLYALVTQMGTTMRNVVFTEDIVKGLKKWRARARKSLAASKKKSLINKSYDASIGTSPSFGTLDTLDVKSLAVDIIKVDSEHEQDLSDTQLSQQHRSEIKISSFHGFRSSED